MISLIREIIKTYSTKRKWNGREYQVQDNSDVDHFTVKMIFNSTHFPALTFFVQYTKPHVVRGLSKHYVFHLETKLVQGICVILFIPCACVDLT